MKFWSLCRPCEGRKGPQELMELVRSWSSWRQLELMVLPSSSWRLSEHAIGARTGFVRPSEGLLELVEGL